METLPKGKEKTNYVTCQFIKSLTTTKQVKKKEKITKKEPDPTAKTLITICY